MKRLLFYLPVLFLLIFASGCQNKRDITIGLLMDSFKQERWIKDRDIFVSKVEDLGGKVLVESAEGDHDQQVDLAKKMVEKGIDVLVLVAVNYESASEIIDIAHQANVKVIAYDRLVKNANLDFYISFDNINVGELQAEYLSSMKPNGNYVLIGGARSDNNAYLLHQGQMNVLDSLVKKGNIKILHDEYVDKWQKSEGYQQMKKCLELSDSVDVVIAANDQLATGVIEALDDHGLKGKVLVAGQDADMDACKRIINGTQAITVYKPIRKLATRAAEISIKLAKGEELMEKEHIDNGAIKVPSVLLETMVVSKETMLQTVVADGYLQESSNY